MDMDGLLIDTEPIWRLAETAVLAGLGIELTEADLLETTGHQIGAVVAHWMRTKPRQDASAPRAPGRSEARPGGAAGHHEPSEAEVTDEITGMVIAQVTAEGKPMDGVSEAIALFERWGLALAIASSSPRRLIDAVCDQLGLGFITVRCSAAGSVKGKPAPDVYLAAARQLGTPPAQCLAIEDSLPGVAAAKAAGMRCIAVPDRQLAADPRYQDADLVLPTLAHLDERMLTDLGVCPRPDF